jgi:hypothetical protein
MLHIKVNTIVFFTIITSGLLYFIVLRMGAKVRLYDISGIILLLYIVRGGNIKVLSQYMFIAKVVLLFLIINYASSIIGYLTFPRYQVAELQWQQLKHPAAVLILENFRLTVSVGMFIYLLSIPIAQYQLLMRRALPLLLLITGLVAVITVIPGYLEYSVVFSEAKMHSSSVRAVGSFYEPTQAAIFFLVIASCCYFMSRIFVYNSPNSKFYRNIHIFGYFMAVHTFSITAFLSIAVSIPVMWLFMSIKKVINNIFKIMLVIILLIILYYFLILFIPKIEYIISNRINRFTNPNDTYAIHTWVTGYLNDYINMFSDTWIPLGNGILQFHFSRSSLYITIFRDTGIYGFLVFVFMLVYMFKSIMSAYKEFKIYRSEITILIFSFCFFLIVFNNYDSPNDLWLWVYYAFLIRLPNLLSLIMSETHPRVAHD